MEWEQNTQGLLDSGHLEGVGENRERQQVLTAAALVDSIQEWQWEWVDSFLGSLVDYASYDVFCKRLSKKNSKSIMTAFQKITPYFVK